MYQATISPESFEQAARGGINLQMASPFTYRTYRETWMDELEKNCQHYDKICREDILRLAAPTDDPPGRC